MFLSPHHPSVGHQPQRGTVKWIPTLMRYLIENRNSEESITWEAIPRLQRGNGDRPTQRGGRERSTHSTRRRVSYFRKSTRTLIYVRLNSTRTRSI